MSNSNKVKAEFLGMPYGTAAHRLRKLLMFKFAQELGYDDCFACGEKIETADELSIEHKEPWLHRSVDKFWDLSNIAFSHLRCNVRSFENNIQRKVGPDGTAWCSRCKVYKTETSFWKNARRWNGLDSWCADCNKATRDAGRKR